MFGQLIILFAFILGFALSRASSCTVAATTRWVTIGKPDWLVGIMIAVCWSAVTLLALNVVFAGQIAAPLSVPINFTLVIASIAMGVGAFLNSGCFIGSIGRISGGDLSYLMTFVGLVVARFLGNQAVFSDTFSQRQSVNSLVMEPAVYWGVTSLFLAVFLYSCIRIFRKRQQAIIALCVMGVFAALTFASNSNWSYEAWVGRIVSGRGVSNSYQIELTIFALFTGAIISSALNGKFALRMPRLQAMVMCFSGGILMGLGAKFVPGGNDTLLLWTIPSFALHGFVAYIIMVATVALLVLASGKR